MEQLLVALVAVIGTPIAVIVVLFIVTFQNPDKAQHWAEMIWTLVSKVHQSGRRRAVQYGVQSRLTYFAADLAKETGAGRATPVVVEWAQPDESPSSFLADNRVVIRLHSRERQDRNLMISSMFFVSDTLVRRAKRFLSKRQARSIDLYAVDRLLTKTAPAAADLLHEEVMGPACDADRELARLIIEYQQIDRRTSMFFPVFVRELNYLAQKVVVQGGSRELIADVKLLHDFLLRYSERTIGEDMPPQVQGRYLKCAIMIVAKSIKRDIGDTRPYVRYLEDLSRAGHETIYMVGSGALGNRDFMQAISDEFAKKSGWREVERRRYQATLKRSDGADNREASLLIVLRSNEAREYVGIAEAVDPMGEEDAPCDAEVGPDEVRA